MSVNQKSEFASHKIFICNRNEGSITGIKDVISFDLDTIVLETVMGILTLKGKELHVKSINLDKSQVEFEGNVNEMIYSDTKTMKRKSFVGRVFG